MSDFICISRKQFGRAGVTSILATIAIGALSWQSIASGDTAQRTLQPMQTAQVLQERVPIQKLSPRSQEQLETLQIRGLKPSDRYVLGNLNIPIFPFLPYDPRITFNDGARTLCYYRNNFFEKNVRGSFELLQGGTPVDSFGDAIDPPLIEKFGHYYVAPSQPGSYTMHVICDGFAYDTPVTVPNPVTNFQLPDIQLNNAPPAVTSFEAKVGGNAVVGAPKNTTVTLVANASDPNGDPLTFTWGANAGTITSTSANTAKWLLPNSTGLNFAYVLVSDGKGGYTEKHVVISTDGNVVQGTQAAPSPATSDKVPLADHFLTFFSTKDRHVYLPRDSLGADTKMGSCRYYVAIGAAEGCDDHGNLINPLVTFSSWKKKWTLDVPGSGSHATYANKADLNLQRDMHGITTSNGTAFYVCNYPRADNKDVNTNLGNAVNNKNLVACVAMEYSPTPGVNGNQPYTKFLTFAPSGKLLQSVNLDTRGEKYLPGSCVVCHGANHDFSRVAENGSTSPAMNSQFLPFDLNNFAFGSGALTQANLEVALRSLNKLVLNTNPSPAIVDLIGGWYPTPASTFTNSFVPAGWAGHETLYNNVVKPHCRTCHVAMVPDNPSLGLSFRSFNEFHQFNFELDARVCGNDVGVERKRYSMPNSLVTFNRFWGDPNAASTLRAHLIAEGEITSSDVCNPPQ